MRIAVGMSGGVDSTIVAALLIGQGHEVFGVTMKTWDGSVNLPPGGRSSCYSPDEAEELETIRCLCVRLGIPHHTIPLEAEYREHVLDYFRREYLAGRTPNPCVRCNHSLKFGFLLSKIEALGIPFDRFATGHYARVDRDPDTARWVLRKGMDADKDQSYFLSRLTQAQLGRVLFPLGEWTKTQVREKARELELAEVAEQRESQDFIGGDSYAPLFEGMDVKPGPILDQAGRVLGTHQGIVHYTIGQRHGLGVSGQSEPLYVVAIDAKQNAVIVGPRDALLACGLVATDMNWIAVSEPDAPFRATVRIRQQHRGAAADVTPIPGAPGSMQVRFDTAQSSVTPGQAAVLYDDDRVLGGGWIASSSVSLSEERVPR